MRSWSKARRLGLDEHSLHMWTYRQHHDLQVLLGAANWNEAIANRASMARASVTSWSTSHHFPVQSGTTGRPWHRTVCQPHGPHIKTSIPRADREERSVRVSNADVNLKTNYHYEWIQRRAVHLAFSATSIHSDISTKHRALTCAAFFLGPLGGWGQISEKQDASNQPLNFYMRHTLWFN